METIYCFFCCVFFAIIFRAPKKELIFCGITGSLGWLLYEGIDIPFSRPIVAAFFASVMVTSASRFLSHIRRAPSTLYLLPGIIPMVPGSGLYYTMYCILNNDLMGSYEQGVYTLKMAGAISVGIIIVLSMPYKVFNFIELKEEK